MRERKGETDGCDLENSIRVVPEERERDREKGEREVVRKKKQDLEI